jgi:Uma2 family endonuclease
VQTKIDDYLGFGVRYIWLVDPETKRAWVYTREGMIEARDVLRTEEPNIAIPISDIVE